MATPVLLHACCGPCSTYTVVRLREQSLEPTALWYNPNIHPFMEHSRRLESMQAFAQHAEMPLVVIEGYDFIQFLRTMYGREHDRCAECYRLRLGRAAAEAKQRGFSAFTTTLLISPYQNHERLREVGQEVAQEHGVEFYYEDLRPGFPESRRLARELGLYRQQYCGCIYSEWERYARRKVGVDLTPGPFPKREGETALAPNPFPGREVPTSRDPRTGERLEERSGHPHGNAVGLADAALTPGPFPKREGELGDASPRVGERLEERSPHPHNIVVGQKVDYTKAVRAKELRHEQTPAEQVLWQALRTNQLKGWHFRRQQVIGGFIADFYCHAAGLVIEVDGTSHNGQAEYDRERESALAAYGLRILRFKNEEVLHNLPKVLARIRQQLDLTPGPFPGGEGGTHLTPNPFPKREGGLGDSSPRAGERPGERSE